MIFSKHVRVPGTGTGTEVPLLEPEPRFQLWNRWFQKLERNVDFFGANVGFYKQKHGLVQGQPMGGTILILFACIG